MLPIHNRSAAKKFVKNHVLADEVLIGITPDDGITTYLNLKAFGTVVAPAPDSNSRESRHATAIAYLKRQVECDKNSREPDWELWGQQFLKNLLKKNEAEKKGARLRTWRTLIDQEFFNLQAILSRAVNNKRRTWNWTLMKMQLWRWLWSNILSLLCRVMFDALWYGWCGWWWGWQRQQP